jgi:hypothetical protein
LASACLMLGTKRTWRTMLAMSVIGEQRKTFARVELFRF